MPAGSPGAGGTPNWTSATVYGTRRHLAGQTLLAKPWGQFTTPYRTWAEEFVTTYTSSVGNSSSSTCQDWPALICWNCAA